MKEKDIKETVIKAIMEMYNDQVKTLTKLKTSNSCC